MRPGRAADPGTALSELSTPYGGKFTRHLGDRDVSVTFPAGRARTLRPSPRAPPRPGRLVAASPRPDLHETPGTHLGRPQPGTTAQAQPCASSMILSGLPL